MRQELTTLDDYPYGYCEIGQRFEALRSGRRTERVSWIAALKEKEIFAPMTFTGTCNRDLFEMWLEKCLLPKLNPGDIIVIDNASFHKSQAIEDLIAKFGCELLGGRPVQYCICHLTLLILIQLRIGGLYSKIG